MWEVEFVLQDRRGDKLHAHVMENLILSRQPAQETEKKTSYTTYIYIALISKSTSIFSSSLIERGAWTLNYIY